MEPHIDFNRKELNEMFQVARLDVLLLNNKLEQLFFKKNKIAFPQTRCNLKNLIVG